MINPVTANITITRRLGDSSTRTATLRVRCEVLEQGPSEPPEAGAQAADRTVALVIPRREWADPSAPATGDSASVPGYPPMRVLSCDRLGPDWHLICRCAREVPDAL